MYICIYELFKHRNSKQMYNGTIMLKKGLIHFKVIQERKVIQETLTKTDFATSTTCRIGIKIYFILYKLNQGNNFFLVICIKTS